MRPTIFSSWFSVSTRKVSLLRVSFLAIFLFMALSSRMRFLENAGERGNPSASAPP